MAVISTLLRNRIHKFKLLQSALKAAGGLEAELRTYWSKGRYFY
jgi:hypothetical protein